LLNEAISLRRKYYVQYFCENTS